MKVYIANFGLENYEWPACKARSTVATMNTVDVQPFWIADDREGYIRRCLLGKTAAGITPTRPVASRWFNLMSIIAQTEGDKRYGRHPRSKRCSGWPNPRRGGECASERGHGAGASRPSA